MTPGSPLAMNGNKKIMDKDDPPMARIPGKNFGWFHVENAGESSVIFTIEMDTKTANQRAMTFLEIKDVKEIIKIRSFLDSFILDRLSELSQAAFKPLDQTKKDEPKKEDAKVIKLKPSKEP